MPATSSTSSTKVEKSHFAAASQRNTGKSRISDAKPGRPATGTAKTPAERMRAYRARLADTHRQQPTAEDVATAFERGRVKGERFILRNVAKLFEAMPAKERERWQAWWADSMR